MQIEITLDQALKFIQGIRVGARGGPTYRALVECVPVLQESLLKNVFRKPHSDTVTIPTKADLQALIKSGSSHQPANARPGPQYNQEYLARKRRLGEFYPHKYMEYGFWMGIDTYMRGSDLVMKTEPIIHRGFDYMSHHEGRRSVLKRAFLDAWQDVINTLIKHYAKEAKS